MFFRNSSSSNNSVNSKDASTNNINAPASTREDNFSVTYDRCLGISLIGADPVFRTQSVNKNRVSVASSASQSSVEKSVVIDIAPTPKRAPTLKWGRSKASSPSKV